MNNDMKNQLYKITVKVDAPSSAGSYGCHHTTPLLVYTSSVEKAMKWAMRHYRSQVLLDGKITLVSLETLDAGISPLLGEWEKPKE